MKPAPESPTPTDAVGWLRQGHFLEAEGTAEALAAALRAYDVVISLLRPRALDGPGGVRRDLGGAWMNRGNVLQKQANGDSLAAALHSYDEAIALLRELPIDAHPPHRNCLGSAWMNRGHALLQFQGPEHVAAAIASHETAVEVLRLLPIDEVPAYRLNLAGAEINLANALLLTDEPAACVRSRALAREALSRVAGRENTAVEFADLGLKARRAQCEAIGRLIVEPHADRDALADEASDLVDDGLALARRWSDLGVPHFHLLATRLFRFGAQLCRLHQPQFLAEFIEEQLAVSNDPEFQAIALENIDATLRGQPGDPILVAGDPVTERRRETGRDLGRLRTRLVSRSLVA